MNAAPRAIFDDFREIFGGILFQKLSVIRELGGIVFLNFFESVGERHFAEVMVVTIALAVCSNVDQLRKRTAFGEATHEPIGKTFTVAQQALECNSLGNWPIVEKQ